MRRIGVGDVEVDVGHRGDRAVGEVLHPVAERLAAVDHAGRVGVEVGDRRVDVGAGEDPLGGGVHQVGQPLQLGPAPGVGLVEVDLGAEEVAARERVDLPPDPLALRALRLELVGEEQPERRGGGARGTRQGSQLGAVADLAAGRRGRGRSRRASPVCPVQRRTCSATSAYCRAATTLPLRASSDSVTRRPSRAAGTPDRRDAMAATASVALGRHQVEDPADLVQRAPQHRHARAVDARFLQLDLQPGPLEERVPRRGLAVVDRGRGLDGGDRAPRPAPRGRRSRRGRSRSARARARPPRSRWRSAGRGRRSPRRRRRRGRRSGARSGGVRSRGRP